MAKNFINLEGRIVNQISFTEQTNGNKIASFTLAISDYFKVKDKKENKYIWKEKVQFIPIVAFGSKSINQIEETFSTKDLVKITGKIEYKTYQDKEQNWKTYFAVVPKLISLVQKFEKSIKKEEQLTDDQKLKEKTLNNLDSLNTANGQPSESERQEAFNNLKTTVEAFLNDDPNIFQEDVEIAFKKHQLNTQILDEEDQLNETKKSLKSNTL